MAIYLFALASMLCHLAFAGSRVVTSLLAIELGANPFQIGVLAALYAIGPLFLAIYTGKLIDRIGARMPMIAGMLGIMLCLLFAAGFPKLLVVFSIAPALGLSFMLFLVAVQGVTGAIGATADRARNYGILAIGFSVAAFFGPLIAGFAIDYLGYSAALLILAGCTVAPVFLLWFKQGLVPRPERGPDKGSEGSVKDLLRVPALRNTFITSGILSGAWDLYNFYLPVYAHHIGHSASAIGMILAAFAAATVVIRLFLSTIVRQGGEMRALNQAIYVAAAAYFLLPFFQSAWVLAAISFLLGLGVGTGQPLSMSLIYSLAPKNRTSEAAGVRVTVNHFTHVTIPLIFGGLGSFFGFAPVFLCNAVLLVSSAFFNQRATRR